MVSAGKEASPSTQKLGVGEDGFPSTQKLGATRVKKIAVFYIEAGMGHKVPSLAICLGFRALGFDVELFDFFAVCRSPFWSRFTRSGWRVFLRVPSLERFFRRVQQRYHLVSVLARTFRWVLLPRFKAWQQQYKPELMIATNSVPLWLLPLFVRDLGLRTPCVSYNTDVFYNLPSNINNTARRIFTPTEQSALMLARQGQRPQSIRLCPFPLHPRLEGLEGAAEGEKTPLSASLARAQVCLPERFTVMLHLGGEGIGSFQLITQLARLQLPVQCVVLGKMTALSNRLFERCRREYPDFPLVALGFVSEVRPWILSSDIIVGKAGANAICEALYLRRPFLISSRYYLSEYPAAFLRQHGVGWMARNTAEAASIIASYMQNQDERERVSERFQSLPLRFGSVAFATSVYRDLCSE